VESIYTREMGITSLKGIECFVNLTSLDCEDNKLKTLDVSKLKQLYWLDCRGNALTKLDVSKNAKLNVLDCSDNKLKTLDVSRNSKLHSLHCSNTLIKSLDVSKNSKLYSLEAENTPLTSIKLGRKYDLEYLFLSGTKLASVDISGCGFILEALADPDFAYVVSKNTIDWGGGEYHPLSINTSTKVMNGKEVLFTYTKPKTFKFTKASVTMDLDDGWCNLWPLLNRTPANSVYKTTFTCDKEGVIELDRNSGYFELLKKGTVTVTARSGGKKAKIKVIVK